MVDIVIISMLNITVRKIIFNGIIVIVINVSKIVSFVIVDNVNVITIVATVVTVAVFRYQRVPSLLLARSENGWQGEGQIGSEVFNLIIINLPYKHLHATLTLYNPHLIHPNLSSPTQSLTHSLTHSPIHSFIFSLAHSLTHPFTHSSSRSLTHSPKKSASSMRYR